MKKLLTLTLFLLAGCIPQLRPDPAPSPSDLNVNQSRLEFHGCGYRSLVGTASCYPGQAVKVVTEFEGNVTYAASGAGCSLRDDIAATPPETSIPTPQHPPGVSCAVIVIYLPKLPNKASPIPTRSLYGEVIFQPDNSYQYKGNIGITDLETVKLTFPGNVRGAYTSRQFNAPIQFSGDTVSFRPLTRGTDLILIKMFDAAGKATQFSYTANYYSAQARKLTYSLTRNGDYVTLKLDEAVSVATIEGAQDPMFDLEFQLSADYSGIVRAYSAKGRTLVLGIKKGKVAWVH
jgi:hypothetical protein